VGGEGRKARRGCQNSESSVKKNRRGIMIALRCVNLSSVLWEGEGERGGGDFFFFFFLCVCVCVCVAAFRFDNIEMTDRSESSILPF
jgi:hypothetical protein